MALTRREFIKSVGIVLASLMHVRCTAIVQKRATSTAVITCYEPVAPPVTPTPTGQLVQRTAILSDVTKTGDVDPNTIRQAYVALNRDRLRACWVALDRLAERAAQDGERSERGRKQLVAEHRAVLDELVTVGELTGAVADQVQIAFTEAAYHIWATHVPLICYEPMMVDYKPASSDQLAQRVALLAEMTEQGDLDSIAIAQARADIERDIAFLSLFAAEGEAVYDKLRAGTDGAPFFPPFDELDLEIAPEAAQAARFLVDLLLDK
jgi:hypothetical protein